MPTVCQELLPLCSGRNAERNKMSSKSSYNSLGETHVGSYNKKLKQAVISAITGKKAEWFILTMGIQEDFTEELVLEG